MRIRSKHLIIASAVLIPGGIILGGLGQIVLMYICMIIGGFFVGTILARAGRDY